MNLHDLPLGQFAVIKSVKAEKKLRQHLLDMGLIPETVVKMVKHAPMGDPLELSLRGYTLTLRKSDAAQIEIETIAQPAFRQPEHVADTELKKETPHPGLGEDGLFHSKKDEKPLPDHELLSFALIGNQNSGKTTLFNQLTGAKQHVGNFPGVTVDRKNGQIKHYANTVITDLPGIYSMTAYSDEEKIAINFLLENRPHCIINIVDATNIERNLYLTMQLLSLNIPVIVALNMMDELANNGGSIDINAMEELLGVPVIPISASKNQGVDELVRHAVHIAHYQEKPQKQDFCDKDDNGGAVHNALHAIIHLIQNNADKTKIPARFATDKLLEDDEYIINKLNLDNHQKETINKIAEQLEKERGIDKNAALADMRFRYIEKVCSQTVNKPIESKEQNRSKKIDQLLTGKYTAIPLFFGIMALIFYLTFNLVGAGLQGLFEEWIEAGTGWFDEKLTAWGANEVLHGLIIDGIFAGVGSVLTFLPIIVVLFFFLAILEDSGYIARVAFVMDRLLRGMGLSGRSIVPMLIGFGCSVPAIMATRTLPSDRDRKMTVLLTPMMSCTAKLPIYAFFVAAFFPKQGGLIMSGLYLFGIITAILIALIYRKTLFKGEPIPFVLEIPPYRFPTIRNIVQLLWEKAKGFIQRAFTVIFLGTIIIWFLQSFDLHFNLTEDSSTSILAAITGIFAPIMQPLGLGDWRVGASLVAGFIAKEGVVSSMEVLFGDNLTAILTPLTAATMLVFSLLYTPCLAAIATVKRELGGKWAVFVVIWQCVIAWILAMIVKLVLMAFGVQ
ncbi:MAG: ferrous iron transport protein B [Neisseriaceae bacterium]|nr:ferrous iron transport protein B [Neisseriaceae bacterium]